jgi:hypothetical protein
MSSYDIKSLYINMLASHRRKTGFETMPKTREEGNQISSFARLEAFLRGPIYMQDRIMDIRDE